MIKIDDYEIRESGFQYFYCLADAIGNKFDPLFDKLFPLAIKWAQDQSEIKIINRQKRNDFSLDSDSEEDQTLNMDNIELDINILQQKNASI